MDLKSKAAPLPSIPTQDPFIKSGDITLQVRAAGKLSVA
jgi:hypothetical protein